MNKIKIKIFIVLAIVVVASILTLNHHDNTILNDRIRSRKGDLDNNEQEDYRIYSNSNSHRTFEAGTWCGPNQNNKYYCCAAH